MDDCLVLRMLNARLRSDKYPRYIHWIHSTGVRTHEVRIPKQKMDALMIKVAYFDKRHHIFEIKKTTYLDRTNDVDTSALRI